MTLFSSVLVVFADETKAALCVNSDGVTRVLRTIYQVVPVKDGDRRARHNFACQVMMVLSRYLAESTYDGVMILAEAAMIEELHEVQTFEVSRALIAEIVGKPFEVYSFPDFNAASVPMAYQESIN